MSTNNEVYLGDGLYASFDGHGITLHTPRVDGMHWVYLEDRVLAEFLCFVDTLRTPDTVAKTG